MSAIPCGREETLVVDQHRDAMAKGAAAAFDAGVDVPFTRAAKAAEETRVTDPVTGGQKGSKLARFSLIPPDFLWALAEHYGRGALKYEDRNWQKGYKWGLSLDALDRHLIQWLMGEDLDAETGTHHLVAVAWHAIALWWWSKRNLGTDDIRDTTITKGG